MKHNGQNIITDKDITLTGEGFQGEELSGVLTNHTDRLNTLESNIKWIYKNGGVGSGSGGGGDSTGWSVIITRGDTNQAISDKATVNFPKEGNYVIKIQIYKGGQSTFKITFNWVILTNNGPQPQSRTRIIGKDESFYVDTQLLLNLNGTLTITILNQDTQDVVYYNINYIVTSYKFDMYYVFEDDKTKYDPSNDTLFMIEVKDRGLLVALSYSIAVETTIAEYTFSNWNCKDVISSRDLGEEYQIHGKSTGIIYLPLVSSDEDDLIPGNIVDYLNNNENASFKQFSLDLDIMLEGNTVKESIPTMYLRDNLIPASLYLKVYTDAGGLFNESQEIGYDETTHETIYNYPEDAMFSKGSAIFQLTPYYNSLQPNRTFDLSIFYDENEDPIETPISTLRDQKTQLVSISLMDSGEHRLRFRISPSNSLEVYEKTYWFYVMESTINFEWYDTNRFPSLTYNAYYRRFVGTQSFGLTDSSRLIQQTINSSKVTYRFTIDNIAASNEYDQLLCLGFQYSSINNISTPICSFNCNETGNEQETGSLIVYQDKIIMSGGTTKSIYIPKIEEMDDSKKDSYHLLTIYKKFEKLENGYNYYRGIYVYIDGILEAGFDSYTTINTQFKSVSFYNCNCLVNLVEEAYFRHTSENNNTEPLQYLSDNDILRYYYSYREQVLMIESLSQREINLFGFFDTMRLDSDNFVKVTGYDNINKIAINSEIPVLLMSYTDGVGYIPFGVEEQAVVWNRDNLKLWLSNSYDEVRDGPKIAKTRLPITLYWSNGGENLELISDIGSSSNSAAVFRFTLQGSSTLGYRCKNFELFAPVNNDAGKVYVYSPNYDPSDTSSFLPEESFTLKADVVDSSHTNNNAIGTFVNEVTTPFDAARRSQVGSPYSTYIKNCLTGFPILIFLESIYKKSEEDTEPKKDYYFLGIYNFNLGRNSYFNLGYKNTNALPRSMNSGFHIYEINSSDSVLQRGVEVAEIQGNNKYFDFSQFDQTILFPMNDEDATYMFGDMVSIDETRWKNNLVNLLRRTTYAGGYVFDRIGKTHSNSPADEYGYTDGYSAIDANGISKNQVPNYRYQAARDVYNPEIKTFTQLERPGSEGDLTDLVIGDTGEQPEFGASLDFVSLSEYYTICMAFGLVDSVQKNLNLKTWNASVNSPDRPLWYLAFYDMDTCLGVSNSGSKISYFAFSDYWKSTMTGTKLNPVSVYRDFSPPQESDVDVGYFDTPSSYIFAVAKYAYTVLQNEPRLINHPANLWAIYRQSSLSVSDPRYGCLSSSNYFMNKYFVHHLGKVPESAFNYNYQYKYFVKSNQGFDNTNFPKFYGRRINYTEDWLNGRLHLLDSYFNITGLMDIMTVVDGNQILAPTPTAGLVDRNNKDIIVFRDLFTENTQGQQYANLTTTVNVTAAAYSPLIVKTANTNSAIGRYIFPEQRSECSLSFSTVGNQYALFGGSTLWETLSSINPFITNTNTFSINSKYLSQITGTAGKCGSWDINTPSIEKLTLTSPNYSGNLSFDSTGVSSQYPNLSEINISGTYLRLSVSNSNLIKLVANNMRSDNTNKSSIVIDNSPQLNSVSISGTLERIELPAWTSNISLTSLSCESITIRNTKFTGATSLTIQNNSTLVNLSAGGFETITVLNCPKLSSITITDDNNNRLKTLRVRYNSDNVEATSLTIGNTLNTIDLGNQTALTGIQLVNTPAEIIKLPNKSVDLLSSGSGTSITGALLGNKNLLAIDGDGQYYITNRSTFSGCLLYNLRKSDSTYSNIKVKNTTTDLSYTFYVATTSSRKGSMSLNDAAHFLGTCCVGATSVTNVNYLFYNQSITYDSRDFLDDYSSQSCKLGFSNLPKCSTFEDTYYNNNVYYYNRYMFAGNTSSSISITNMIGAQSGWLKIFNGYNVVYATPDFLYEILPKLKTFSPINYDSNRIYFRFIDSSGDVLSEIKLSEIFGSNLTINNGPKNLTTLSSFSICPSSNQTINFEDTFNSNWTAANSSTGLTISRFFWDASYATDNIINLNNLFKNIKLRSASLCFGGVTLSESQRVDMATFINWDNIDSCTNLFYGRNGDLVHDSLVFSKKVSSQDFLSIWDKIITKFKPTSSFSGIGHLFRSCNIYGWTDSEFYLVDPNTLKTFTFVLSGDTSSINVGNIYTNNEYQYTVDEITDINGKVAIVCKTDYTDNIPQNSGELISTDLSSYPSLSFSSVIYKKNTNITKSDCLFLNCRFYTDEDNYINNGSTQYKSITHDFFAPLPNITRYYEDFYGMYWKNPIPFDFFRRRRRSSRVVYVINPEDPDSRIPATYYSYSYTRDIDDVRLCFYNIRLETSDGFDPNAAYNCGSFVNNKTKIIDENGNLYQTYYDTIDSTQEKTIDISTEETDCENVIGHYQEIINISSSIYLQNPSGVDANHLVVPPDILYSISTATGLSNRLDRVFGATTAGGVYRFSGLLPKHLLKNIKILQPTDIVQNLSIVPWYFGTTNGNAHYYFIPENFSNVTTISTMMTFNLLIPGPTNNMGEKIHYYLYRDDSIPITSTNISPTLHALDTQVSGVGSNFQPANTNSNIDFHLMMTPVFDSNGDLINVEEGIDLDKFKDLKLTRLIDENLATFIAGRIFTNDLSTDWRSGYVDQNNYAIRVGISSYGGLSRRCSLNFPISNDRFINGVGSSSLGNRINKNSISNFELINQTTYTDRNINFI